MIDVNIKKIKVHLNQLNESHLGKKGSRLSGQLGIRKANLQQYFVAIIYSEMHNLPDK